MRRDGVEEWKECTLSDLGTIVGGATPSTKDSSNYENGSIAWITPKDLSTYTERFISHGERNITEKGLKSCSAQLMPPNSILFTSRAPIGYIAIAKNEVCTNQGFKSIIPNKDTDFMFLYYLLRYNKDNIENLGSGTTFKEVSGSTMRNVPVKVPPLPTQQKIADILSSLDDKIELNNKINTNLEQQAQALFKNWFVGFEPFGGKMPEEWKLVKLSDIAEITSGKRPPMKQSDYSKDVSIPLVGAASVIGYTNQVLYNEPILITGRVGTHGVIQRFSTDCWPSDNTLVVKSKYYEYVYQIMKNIDYDNMNRGSTQPLITQSDLGKVECIIPDEKNLNKFEQLTAILFSKVHENQQENHKLANIRDTLLPKLMNGDI